MKLATEIRSLLESTVVFGVHPDDNGSDLSSKGKKIFKGIQDDVKKMVKKMKNRPADVEFSGADEDGIFGISILWNDKDSAKAGIKELEKMGLKKSALGSDKPEQEFFIVNKHHNDDSLFK